MNYYILRYSKSGYSKVLQIKPSINTNNETFNLVMNN